ncbi:MAG: glycosyltransferase [Actinomycetes bacterium]
MLIVQIANLVHQTSGGISRTMTELRNEYRALGHQVVVITPSDHFSDDTDESGVRRIQLKAPKVPGWGGYRLIWRRRQLKKLLIQIVPDVIENHDQTTLWWLGDFSQKIGAQSFVFSHESLSQLLTSHLKNSWLANRLADNHHKRIARGTQNFLCASHFAALELERIGIKPIKISLGVDHTQFGSNQEIQNLTHQFHGRNHTVALVGRLSPEKNPQLAIEAMRKICDHRGDIQLVVIGDGPLRQKLVDQSLGLPIKFLGHIADREFIASILRLSFCTLNLGDRETFSLSTLESLASGTPAIVAKSGASREILASECGVSTSLTPICIADAIESMLRHDRKAVHDICQARARQFTWEKTAKVLLQNYQTVEFVQPKIVLQNAFDFGQVA